MELETPEALAARGGLAILVEMGEEVVVGLVALPHTVVAPHVLVGQVVEEAQPT